MCCSPFSRLLPLDVAQHIISYTNFARKGHSLSERPSIEIGGNESPGNIDRPSVPYIHESLELKTIEYMIEQWRRKKLAQVIFQISYNYFASNALLESNSFRM